jgi:hypothetical protein
MYSSTHSLTSALDGGVSFTPRPLYSQEKSPSYPLDRRLDEPQSRSGRSGEEKNSQPHYPDFRIKTVRKATKNMPGKSAARPRFENVACIDCLHTRSVPFMLRCRVRMRRVMRMSHTRARTHTHTHVSCKLLVFIMVHGLRTRME